jgi:phenylpropionate dioxygenase-like ring-hydroxylating dioxygenase large terminal subunit
MPIADHPTSFTTLPRDFYVRPDLYESEIRRIWYDQWLYLAHVSELPDVGDFIVRELCGESVIVVRVSAHEIAASLNVCRHRGARLVDDSCGRANRFVCPYHQWTYHLDGTLKAAPSMPADEAVDYSRLGLLPVELEIWRGLVFGCLGGNRPPSLAEEIEARSPQLARYAPERLRKAHQGTYPVDANWKMMMENYCECYHCSGSHPEFCLTADLGIRSEAEYQDTAYSTEPYWNLDIPLRPGAKTASMSGEHVVGKLLVDPADHLASGRSRGFVLQPAFTVLYFYADYAMVHEIRPLAVDKTEFHIHWFVSADAGDDDFDLDDLTHVWDATTRQDVALVERSQVGVNSRRYVPGPLSVKHEPGIRAVLDTYLERMAGELLIPELFERAPTA